MCAWLMTEVSYNSDQHRFWACSRAHQRVQSQRKKQASTTPRGANSFDYLTELQRHAQDLAATPVEWMPWNYRETLERTGAEGLNPNNLSCGFGLVEVKPLDRKAYGAAGAFTNIVTWACDIEGFRKKTETIAATLDMFVADIEGAEPLADRIKGRRSPRGNRGHGISGGINQEAIVYGTFHRYPFDEA